jgi:hypothetical protein
MTTIFTEELKYVRSPAIVCDLCNGVCKGHRLKISWEDVDPKFENVIWIDNQPAYQVDDTELSTITHLKWNFPQNGPGEVKE